MHRLTVDKPTSEMSMTELAHNSCYARNRWARYRNYDLDIDAIELVMKLYEFYCNEDFEDICNDEFDNWIEDYMQYNLDSLEGLLAAFYTHIWAMADLREELKDYEDLKEQGRLLKLPCKFGDTVFVKRQSGGYAQAKVVDFTHFLTCGFCVVVASDEFGKCNIPFSKFGETVFHANPDADNVK